MYATKLQNQEKVSSCEYLETPTLCLRPINLRKFCLSRRWSLHKCKAIFNPSTTINPLAFDSKRNVLEKYLYLEGTTIMLTTWLVCISSTPNCKGLPKKPTLCRQNCHISKLACSFLAPYSIR